MEDGDEDGGWNWREVRLERGGVQRTEYSGGGDFGREVICAHSGAEQTRAAGVPGKIK